MSLILIVDDDAGIRSAVERLLRREEYQVASATSGLDAIRFIEQNPVDLMITDIQMLGITGLELFRRLKVTHPKLPAIIITGQGNSETAIEATKLGAYEYLRKPFDPNELLSAIEQCLQTARLMSDHPPSPTVARGEIGMIGNSTAIEKLFKAIGRVAATDAPVLIRGETGTGKELVAKAIHRHSSRADQPLLALNAAAIPEPLLESELFGHEKGAFTGADRRRIGKFEQAFGGTLFLDEIGDMPPLLQAKLLRVLQEHQIERVGGDQLITIDVRIIAATHQSLETRIAEGKFREDFFQRLNVVTLVVPPLRERREDIPLLAAYFLSKAAEELHTHPGFIQPAAMEHLLQYPWPGNIRELEHCLKRALIFSPNGVIDISELPPLPTTSSPSPDSSGSPDQAEMSLDQLERDHIIRVLAATNGNKRDTAKILGISRSGLYERIKRHRIE